MYTLYKFHFLNGISEINQLFDDVLIIWPAPVYTYNSFLVFEFDWLIRVLILEPNRTFCISPLAEVAVSLTASVMADAKIHYNFKNICVYHRDVIWSSSVSLKSHE